MQKILPRSGLVQQAHQRGPAKEKAGRLCANRYAFKKKRESKEAIS